MKLDLFKNLLGEAAESNDFAERHQSQSESDREEDDVRTEMSQIKLEREELRIIMQEAMAAGESRAINNPLTAASVSARSGGDVDERGELFAVSIKLADFWSEDPESWFDRADNQFITRGIKEDATKFSHAVQALSYTQHKEVKALIRNPPKGTSYPALKAALISAFGKTQLDRDLSLIHI